MNRKSFFRLTIAIAILILSIGWLSASVDFNVVSAILDKVDIALLLVSVPIIISSHIVRAVRWRRMLSHLPERLSVINAFSSTLIGYAASLIVPRSGELLRPYVLAQRSGVRFPVVLSSVVLERVIDVLTLLLGIIILIIIKKELVTNAFPEISYSQIITSIAIPLIALSLLIVLVAFTRVGSIIVDRLVAPVSLRLATFLRKILDDVKLGTQSLKTIKVWFQIVLDSVIMWTLYAIPLWLVLYSMPWDGSGFTLVDAFVLLVIISVGVTIAPTPGALGIYQGFAQTALVRLYGATSDEGFVFGVLAWLINYGTALIVGGICFLFEMRAGLRLRNTA